MECFEAFFPRWSKPFWTNRACKLCWMQDMESFSAMLDAKAVQQTPTLFNFAVRHLTVLGSWLSQTARVASLWRYHDAQSQSKAQAQQVHTPVDVSYVSYYLMTSQSLMSPFCQIHFRKSWPSLSTWLSHWLSSFILSKSLVLIFPYVVQSIKFTDNLSPRILPILLLFVGS